MKRLIVAIVVVLAGLVLASPAQAYPAMPQGVQGPYTVLKVVDGDTIHVSANGQKLKIRMIGLDTPETVDPRKPVQCFGLEASAQAKTILGGQSVYLETDPSQDTIDKYGRTLAYVWTASGRLFNLDMIADGYAFEYTYDLPYRYQADFKAAENDARTQSAGCGRRTPVRNETWGQSGPERKRNTVKKMITAAIGGALLSGALLGAGAANADAYYENCTAAWDAGVAPLAEGDDGYEAPRLDRDEDGIACEKDPR